MTISITGWRKIPASIKENYLPPMLSSLAQISLIIAVSFVISFLYHSLLTASWFVFSVFALFTAMAIWVIRLLLFVALGAEEKEKIVSIVEEESEVTHSRYYQPVSQWVAKNLGHISLARWEAVHHWISIYLEGITFFLEKILDTIFNSVLAGGRLGLGFAAAIIFMSQTFDIETFVAKNIGSFVGCLIALAIVNLGIDLIFGGDLSEEIATKLTDDNVEVVVNPTPELSGFFDFSLYVENALRHVASLLSFLFIATYPLKALLYQPKFLEILLGLVVATVMVSLVESLFTFHFTDEPNFISADWRLNYAITIITVVSFMLIWLLSAFLPQDNFGELINNSIILPLLGVIMLLSLITPFIRGDES